MTSPDCVSAGLGIDVIEAEDVPNVRDLFERHMGDIDFPAVLLERREDGSYRFADVRDAFKLYTAGYRAAGGQGA